MDDDEILELLKRNANDEILAEFVTEIFMYEFNGSGSWEKTYDKLLDNLLKNEVNK